MLEQLFWNGKCNGLQYDIKLNSLIGKGLPESDLLMENFEDFAVYGKVIEVTSGGAVRKKLVSKVVSENLLKTFLIFSFSDDSSDTASGIPWVRGSRWCPGGRSGPRRRGTTTSHATHNHSGPSAYHRYEIASYCYETDKDVKICLTSVTRAKPKEKMEFPT